MRPIRLAGVTFTISEVSDSGYFIKVSDEERYEVMMSNPERHTGHRGLKAGDKVYVTANPNANMTNPPPLIQATIKDGCGCEIVLRPLDDGERWSG